MLTIHTKLYYADYPLEALLCRLSTRNCTMQTIHSKLYYADFPNRVVFFNLNSSRNIYFHFTRTRSTINVKKISDACLLVDLIKYIKSFTLIVDSLHYIFQEPTRKYLKLINKSFLLCNHNFRIKFIQSS